MSQSKLNKAMILAAGFGTRLKPLTDKMPKPLISYKGKPMISHVINKLTEYGITDITVNTHYFSEQIEKYFKENDFGVKINLIHEENILGTGGGIKNAEKYFEDAENFLVYNTDVNSEINLHELFKFYTQAGAFVMLAVKKKESSRSLIMDGNNNLLGRVSSGEKLLYKEPDGGECKVTFCGVHILSNKIFRYFPPEDSFDIIRVYMKLIESGEKILCYDIGSVFWADMGTLENLKTA